jgi:flagellin-like hook-associated protein FlgL
MASGQRINRAGDDAAGLSIASALNASSRVYSQGQRNLSDGISFYSIAEGATTELTDILARQAELAEQSANGTFTDTQRQALNTEFRALSDEYTRIVQSTKFNGLSVFSAGTHHFQVGYGDRGTLSVSLGAEAAALPDEITNVSTTSTGAAANNASQNAAVSADGRYIAYSSTASNLVSGDTNGAADIFVKDALTGTVERISVSSLGVQGNSNSYNPSISADGRYVAFQSSATNLVAGDTNFTYDIFVHDRVTGSTTRVSVDSAGAQAAGQSYEASISADGRYVAFQSSASNLVAGDTNATDDIFVHDLQTGTTSRVSISTSGSEANGQSLNPVISANGRYVTYQSIASSLAAGDTNGTNDIFVRDLVLGTTTRASISSAGVQGNSHSYNPSISSDGRYVTFEAFASNLVTGDINSASDIFVRDLLTGTTQLVSKDAGGGSADGGSTNAWISGDGRYVAFQSAATDLVSGDTNGVTDVFVRDLSTGATTRPSTNKNGVQGTAASTLPVLSSDGQYVVFQSTAANLTGGDSNGASDIFFNPRDPNATAESYVLTVASSLSVGTRSDALAAMGQLEGLKGEISTVRGAIGSALSRFQVAISVLRSTVENYEVAASRIRDAEMAEESANLVRQTILQQASTAVLSQANQQPKLTLTMLSV